jgi:BirA family transcriptional regulator, biotin operon repressor / biotin---[acetyl-CoA-carboxylase] ligase
MIPGTVGQQGDSPLPDTLRERLPRSLFTRTIYYAPVLRSTNARAKELAKRGEAEGALVITERQTRGRGRLGRQWRSPQGVNLLFSVLFRPAFSLDRVFSLTMLVAASLVDAIREMSGLNALIKWPNDIYCNGKKMAGILTEFSAGGRAIEYAVVGIGLNVNWDLRNEPELQHSATSLMNEVGYPVSRIALLSCILEAVERDYGLLLRGEDGFIRDRWNRHSMVIGKDVLIDPQGEKKRATVTGIDRNGALLVEEEGGKASSIVCGDVQVLFPLLAGKPD